MYDMKSKTKLSGQAQSGLKSMLGTSKTFLSDQVSAKRVIIPFNDIAKRTAIHELNPRNQDALTLEAVQDILPSIQQNGVSQEGVAIKCLSTGKLLLLDASRRRYCCIQANVDLPLWEITGSISDEQILAIINDSQEVKRWSYPEHAAYLLKIAKHKGIDTEATTIEELAQVLSIGRESLRKRLQSLKVLPVVRELFIDYEGIPNRFYVKLVKLQSDIERSSGNIEEVIELFREEFNEADLTGDVLTRQIATLDLLTKFVTSMLNKPAKTKWTTVQIGDFKSKSSSIKLSESTDGRKVKVEFTRCLNKKQKEELNKFLKKIASDK